MSYDCLVCFQRLDLRVHLKGGKGEVKRCCKPLNSLNWILQTLQNPLGNNSIKNNYRICIRKKEKKTRKKKKKKKRGRRRRRSRRHVRTHCQEVDNILKNDIHSYMMYVREH